MDDHENIMTDENSMIEAGMNHGYFLSTHEPELTSRFMAIESDDPYVVGLKTGVQEYAKELERSGNIIREADQAQLDALDELRSDQEKDSDLDF